MELKAVAKIENGFLSKFGIPRQSGLCSAESAIVFEPEFRVPEAVRGLEEFSHLWLIWNFSETERQSFSPTVRPPRLGGNKRVGVFATRSPFRPNPIGLTLVELKRIEHDPARGEVLIVTGADMMNGTPIYDIKPYIPYADCRPDAKGGFAEAEKGRKLRVDFPENLLEKVAEEDRRPIREMLENDPRPSYHNDPAREYRFEYKNYSLGFKVDGEALAVTHLQRSDEE